MATKPSSDDETRAKYEAALEAKKSKSGHGSESHTSGSGSGKEHANRSGGKRAFRRKAGG
jgi:hypothetical protein